MTAAAVVGTPTSASNGLAASLPASAIVDAPTGTAEPGAEAAEPSAADLEAKAKAILAGEAEPDAEPTTDPKAAKKPAAEDEEANLSPGWAKLRSQEKRHNRRVAEQTQELNTGRDALKTERASFDSERQAFTAERDAHRALREEAKRSPLKALEQIGWTLPALTKYVADNGQIPAEKMMADMKLEYDEGLKKQAAELEVLKNETKKAEEAKTTRERIEAARGYEVKVWERIKSVITQDFAKYPHIADAVQDPEGAARTHQRVLALQVAAMNGQHPDFPGQEKYLAESDALLYAERELAKIYSWRRTGQAGTVETGQPGAAKPSGKDAALISQGDQSSRTVQKKEPDDMSDEEREKKAKRILAGEED